MKLVQTTLIAGLSFFLSTGISFAADMDDIELTIRVVETDDVEEMHNELSLPGAASDAAREHAENEDGRGLTQANVARETEHEENDASHDEREEHEEAREDHEDEVEDHNASDEEHDEAHEEEDHEKEHEEDRS